MLRFLPFRRRAPRASGDAGDRLSRRPRARRLRRWLLVLAGLLTLFYGLTSYAVTTFLIHNHARWQGSGRGPAAVGLAGETVSLRSTDGTALQAWWLPAADRARGTVVIAHGIDHTREVMLPRAAFLVRAGYNALVLDLRGHGGSAGDVVSPGMLESRDVLAGARFARSRAPGLPVALLGVSYGAVASLRAAAEPGAVGAVIADGASVSSATTYGNIVRHFRRDARSPWWLRAACAVASLPGIVPTASLAYYLRTGFYFGLDFGSVADAAPRVRVPVLLITGGSDWIVPTADARRVQGELTHARTSLVVIPGATHDRTYDAAPDLYRASVLAFLARALPPSGAATAVR